MESDCKNNGVGIMTYTEVSETGKRIDIQARGLNTVYTDLETDRRIKVAIRATRYEDNRMRITRYIDGKLYNTMLYNFNDFRAQQIGCQEDALARTRYFSDVIVMRMFEGEWR